jgi:hypothetical protein
MRLKDTEYQAVVWIHLPQDMALWQDVLNAASNLWVT